VTIESNNPNVLVSKDVNTVGAQSFVVNLVLNQNAINFIVHALEGTVGPATIKVSEPRFTDGTGVVNVVQPAIALNGLNNTTTIGTLAVNANFTVVLGIPSGNGVSLRNIRAGAATVNVTVTSSIPAVGDLVFGGTTAATVTVPITAGSSQSGNIQFHPKTAGQTNVSIAATGFLTAPAGTATVTVTTPGISITDLPVTVGAGLQSSNQRAFLGAGNHGGATVKIESSNPAKALVSPNATTAGTTSILVTLLNNQTQVDFIVQGVEGADGNVVITASAPRFSDGQGTASVVPAAVRFNGLNATATAGGADDPFNIQIGIPNSDGSNLQTVQSVRTRPGSPPLNVTITSANTAAGVLVFGATTGGTVTVPIAAAQNQSANVLFRPVAAGSTLVTAAAPGVITTNAGRVNVSVNP